MFKFFYFLFLGIGITGKLYAEPTKPIQFLLQEPISLFDYGMIRLENHLMKNLMAQDEKDIGLTIDYSWDSNQLSIQFLKRTAQSLDLKTGYRACQGLIRQISRGLLAIESCKQCSKNRLDGRLHHLFYQKRYNNRDIPSSIGNELDRITILEGVVFLKIPGTKPDPLVMRLTCHKELLANLVWFDSTFIETWKEASLINE